MEQFRTRYRYMSADGSLWVARVTPEQVTRIEIARSFGAASGVLIEARDADEYDDYKDRPVLAAKAYNAIRDAAFRAIKGLDEDFQALDEALKVNLPSSKRNVATRVLNSLYR